jgi:hypothetical protein
MFKVRRARSRNVGLGMPPSPVSYKGTYAKNPYRMGITHPTASHFTGRRLQPMSPKERLVRIEARMAARGGVHMMSSEAMGVPCMRDVRRKTAEVKASKKNRK